MTMVRSTTHSAPVMELIRVALRAIGVVLPGAGVLGLVELRGGSPDGDFGQFMGAMALSLLASTLWAAIDALRARIRTVLIRWIVTAFVVGGGLALATEVTAPGSPPGPDRAAEAVSLALFYTVPLLMAAALGVAAGAAVGAARDRLRRRHEEIAGTGTGR